MLRWGRPPLQLLLGAFILVEFAEVEAIGDKAAKPQKFLEERTKLPGHAPRPNDKKRLCRVWTDEVWEAIKEKEGLAEKVDALGIHFNNELRMNIGRWAWGKPLKAGEAMRRATGPLGKAWRRRWWTSLVDVSARLGKLLSDLEGVREAVRLRVPVGNTSSVAIGNIVEGGSWNFDCSS